MKSRGAAKLVNINDVLQACFQHMHQTFPSAHTFKINSYKWEQTVYHSMELQDKMSPSRTLRKMSRYVVGGGGRSSGGSDEITQPVVLLGCVSPGHRREEMEPNNDLIPK